MRVPRWFWLLLLLVLVRPTPTHRRLRAERPEDRRARPPNILLILTDDHRAGVLGIDGDPRRATPNLDRLARQGVRFERAYCNAPICTASRQSLITGRYPHAVGVTQLMTPLPEDAVTLGDWLTEMGYATGACGKMHFNGPAAHGFAERWDEPEWARWLRDHPPEGGDQRRPWRPFGDPARVWLNADNNDMGLPESAMLSTFLADRAIAFLDDHREEPFALVLSLTEPHSPFNYPREMAGTYSASQFTVPESWSSGGADQPLVFRDLNEQDVRGIQAAYFTSLAFADRQIGRVLDALDARRLAANTIVVMVGDNGYLLGEHGRVEKHVLYEPAVRVPLIVRWPGRVEAGRPASGMVELLDLFPTLLDLAGLPAPPGLQGRSFRPLLEAPGAAGRPDVFSEYPENEEAMVRDGRYKLIVGSGRRHRQDGYATARPQPGPYTRLFDLDADPDEVEDLAQDPRLSAVRERLEDTLYDRLVRTRNPSSPAPAGRTRRETIEWCLVPRDRSGP